MGGHVSKDMIVYSHNGAADTGEHSTCVPRYAAAITPCETAAGNWQGACNQEGIKLRTKDPKKYKNS